MGDERELWRVCLRRAVEVRFHCFRDEKKESTIVTVLTAAVKL